MAGRSDNIIGVAMELDVSDLKSGLHETKKAIGQAESQFKSATAGMDNWNDTTEGLSAELEFLNTKLKNQKKNVAGYEAEIGELAKTYGENSERVQKYKDDLLTEQRALAKTEKAIREKTAKLNMLEGAYVDTITDANQLQSSLKRLNGIMRDQKKTVQQYEAQLARAKEEHGETSDEVKELTDKLNKAKTAVAKTEKAHEAYTTQLNRVESETEDVADATDRMTREMKDADDAADKLKGGFTVLKGTLADLASNAVQNFVSGIQGAIEDSREFRTEMSYLEAAANNTGTSFEQAQEKVKNVYSVLGEMDSATEGVNNLMAAGFDGDALDTITDELLGASIKWHDTLKFEGLADGLQETLATGKGTGTFIELLERCGIVAEDFDAKLESCNTQAEKQQYVLDTVAKLGLKGVTDAYRENNATLIDAQEAQFSYEQTMGKVGDRAEPILTTLKNGWADILDKILELTEGVDIEGFTKAIEGGFKWFIDDGLPAIKDGIDFIMEHKDAILTAVIGIGTGFLAWKIATGFVPALMGVAKGIGGVMTALSANPIGLVIAAIAGLVAGFIYLWKNCEGFREFWIGLWEKIKAVVGPVWEFIKTAFIDAWENMKELWSQLVEFFSGLWEGVKNVFSTVVDFFKGLWEGIKGVWSGVKEFFTGLFSGAWEGIKAIWSAVTGFFSAIWEGIKTIFSTAISFYTGIFQSAWNGIKAIWSAVVGFFSGIWNGIKSVFSAVTGFFSNVFSTAWNGIKSIWSTVTGWFRGIWNGIKNAFSSVGSTLGGFFSSAWSNIKSVWSNVGGWFSQKVEEIVGFFKGLPGKLLTIGEDMVKGLWEGINNMVDWICDKIQGFGEDVLGGIKDFFGIESPSKLMRDEVGKMLGEGVGEGILASTKSVVKDAKKFSKNVNAGLQLTVPEVAGVGVSGGVGGVVPANNVTNITNNYNQTLNSPKALDRLTIYRQSKNLIKYKGAY